ITFGGTVTAKDSIVITINSATYTYTVASNDSIATIILNVANLINGTSNGKPDPNVVATPSPAVDEVLLTSRVPGVNGNNIAYTVTVNPATTGGTATETAAAGGANLSGGQNAAYVAPGTLVTIQGKFLSETTLTAVPNAQGFFPNRLG